MNLLGQTACKYAGKREVKCLNPLNASRMNAIMDFCNFGKIVEVNDYDI